MEITMRIRRWVPLATVALIALAGCSSAVEGTFDRIEPATQSANNAIKGLSGAPGLRVTGEVTDFSNDVLQADLRITASGEATGTVTREGQKASVAIVDSKTYVKAGSGFWGSNSAASTWNNQWVAVDNDYLGIDFATVFTPVQVAKIMNDRFFTGAGAKLPENAEKTKVGDVEAFKIPVDQGFLYVSATPPYRLLRIEGDIKGLGDSAGVKLDLNPETQQSIVSALQTLGVDAGQLTTPYSALVSAKVNFTGKISSTCNANGCTIAHTALNAGQIPLIVSYRAESEAAGQILATCTAADQRIEPSKTAAFRCTASGPKWSAFYRAATAPSTTPRSTPYNVASYILPKVDPPPAATCTTANAAGCAKPTITDDAVEASFRANGDGGDVKKWREMIDKAAAGKRRATWSFGSTPTTAYLEQVDDKWFVAQFNRKTGELVAAYTPSDEEQKALLAASGGQ